MGAEAGLPHKFPYAGSAGLQVHAEHAEAAGPLPGALCVLTHCGVRTVLQTKAKIATGTVYGTMEMLGSDEAQARRSPVSAGEGPAALQLAGGLLQRLPTPVGHGSPPGAQIPSRRRTCGAGLQQSTV